MRVLGFDPGVKNLGLAVLDREAPGEPLEVLWSANMFVGEMDAPDTYSRSLVPYLDNIFNEFHFEAVGGEEPPIIMEQIKTTARIQRVCGILDGWACAHDLKVRTRPPTTLKAAARRLLRIEDPKENSKNMMRAAVEKILGGKARRTSHENDAVFAAWACWYNTP